MFKEKFKKIGITTLSVVTVLGMGSSAFAADSSTAVVSALTEVASDITSTITAIAPIALGIAGTFLVWRYGMRFFKSISK